MSHGHSHGGHGHSHRGHGHSHGGAGGSGGDGGHGHSHDDHYGGEASMGDLYSLYQNIDTEGLKCLNERESESIRKVFKPRDRRLDRTEVRREKAELAGGPDTQFVESDADEELIIIIPFTGVVKLKSFCIIGGPDGESPAHVKFFVNRDDIDFDTARDTKAVQEFHLAENINGEIEWPVSVAKFNNVSTLTMFISESHGADFTKITYIGLKGEFKDLKRKAVVANYELRPQAAKNDQLGEVKGSSYGY